LLNNQISNEKAMIEKLEEEIKKMNNGITKGRVFIDESSKSL
jgi:peptidoglycan hydrolase CwlO-like protein